MESFINFSLIQLYYSHGQLFYILNYKRNNVCVYIFTQTSAFSTKNWKLSAMASKHSGVCHDKDITHKTRKPCISHLKNPSKIIKHLPS